MKNSRKSPAPNNVHAFSEKEMEAVYILWDQLEKIPAGEADGVLRHLALGLQKLLRADNVKWMAAVRVLQGPRARQDPLRGWRLRANYELVPDPEDYQKLIAPMYQRAEQLDPSFLIGHATLAVVAGAGKFQVHRLRDGWIPFREFSRSEHYRLHYKALGITDRMWISFPINSTTESVFLIDRWKLRRRFLAKDAALAGTILRGIRGVHRRLFLNLGLHIADKPLSPVLRRIVRELLSGQSEKEIAAAMGQSTTTTHKYIAQIYERFGVHGRAALMALWLGETEAR